MSEIDNTQWGEVEISGGESEGEEESSDFNVGDFIIKNPLKTKPISFAQLDECICQEVECFEDSLSVLLGSKFDSVSENYHCHIENLIRVINFSITNYRELNSPERLFICDHFYRYRHEILCSMVRLMLNLGVGSSDMAFREFGIDSDRTPDIIDNIEGVLNIIEISASASFEKMASSKGLESLGYESKYSKELKMMEEESKPYNYIPLLFDMSQPGNLDYEKEIEKLSILYKINPIYLQVLKYLVQELCTISLESRVHFTPMASMLFSEGVMWSKDHSDLEFFYNTDNTKLNNKTKYRELCISPPVYRKITNIWSRLPSILERHAFADNVLIEPCIDMSNNKVGFNKSRSGVTLQEMESILDREDKISFFGSLKLKLGNSFINASNSESGIKFVEKSKNLWSNHNIEDFKVDSIILRQNHMTNKRKFTLDVDLSKYLKKIGDYFSQIYNCNYYDPDYEDLVLDKIQEFDMSVNNLDPNADYNINGKLETKGLLSMNSLSDISVEPMMDDLLNLQISKNTFDDRIPVIKQKSKMPFIIPIANINETHYSKLNYKNELFLNEVWKGVKESNPYTALILEKICSVDFQFIREKNVNPSDEYLSLRKRKSELSTEMSRLYTLNWKNNQKNKVSVKLKDSKDPIIIESYKGISGEISRITKAMNSLSKKERLTNVTELIRLPTKNKKSNLGLLYSAEMSHYKKRNVQSEISGVGYLKGVKEDYKKDSSIFARITEHLCQNAGENPDLFFEDIETKDVKLLKELKKSAVNEYKVLMNEVKNSYLGHSAAFVSRLAHSLMYYSQMPFSSDYIRADNLGYKDVLLLVKGGKKIFKSKSSKFFRLIYPINHSMLDWYFTGYGSTQSHSLIQWKGNNYLITPWVQWNESILNDSISFYPRLVSFNVLNLNPAMSFKQQFSKVSFNTLLAFHNRRHTEVILANLRYILLATLGDYTGIAEIFKEFSGFNYDCFQSYIRSSIIYRYPQFFNKLKTVKAYQDEENKYMIDFNLIKNTNMSHIFSNATIETEDDLALMIYSTFLMTKAPYQRPVERANNLKGILEIHDYYKSFAGKLQTIKEVVDKTSVILTKEKSYASYVDELFSNDFNFDPKYCSNLGNYIDSILESKNATEKLHTAWISIINQSWDEMSTSTGLRGKYDEVEDFWGQKGYFVVYKEIAKDPEYMGNVKSLIQMDLTTDEKRKMLKSLNIIYKSKMASTENGSGGIQDFLIFHAVDKVQWRGGREIYVMDIFTKTKQQPIEKFMAELCKLLDNELISIPSDRRAQVIHHTIFEKDLPLKDVLTWYLTLDCSKWAPKSNFFKFIPALVNMKCIPPSFKTHFLNYLSKLFRKRIYFNNSEVEVLLKNPLYTKAVEGNLIKDDKVNGYYLLMPYSWVMGIFNYTSSFLHAANQKYFSYLLFKSTIINYKEECVMVMFAHSDDSGGRLTTSTKPLIKRALTLYEINLKACNHLLSKKKSVVSRLYFEILSVIYIFKKLLALLPKFLGGLRFLPTDKGPAQDMLQSYSKCIEVMVAGANFSKAYLVMKFYSYLVFRFYYNRKPTELDFTQPVQYLGLPDAHPLMVLICGSEADTIRLMTQHRDSLLRQMCFVRENINTIDDDGPIKPFKFNIKVRGLKETFLNPIQMMKEYMVDWPIGNVNFHSTPFNLLSFLKKLSDPGFVGSLVNESTTRRISRSYYMRSSESCITKNGNMKISEIKSVMNIVSLYNPETEEGSEAVNSLVNAIFRDKMPSILKELKEQLCKSEVQLQIYEHVSSSPIRILKYLDNLTLEGRSIVDVKRTLKPTHLEISKTAKVFSRNFDPAQMVAYILFPNYRWALPNLSGLETAKVEIENLCAAFKLNLEGVSPETLLRLCRSYNNKSTKEIYMYSQIPAEIRSIRTYSAILTFLSVNSFNNKEIRGLVISVDSTVSNSGYNPTNIDMSAYIINNIISIFKTLTELVDYDFLSELRVKHYLEIGWQGGKIIDFISYCKNKLLEEEYYNYLILQISHLEIKIKTSGVNKIIDYNTLKHSCFYSFTKTQKSRSGWYGKGEIIFFICGNYYLFEIYNTHVVSVRTNTIGKIGGKDLYFILDGLKESNIEMRPNDMVKPSKLGTEAGFGIDIAGDFFIGDKRSLAKCYPCTISGKSGAFIDNLNLYESKELGVNSFILSTEHSIDPVKHKVYTIQVQTGDIINTIRALFDPTDFEEKIITSGLTDFEDFIYTEILTKYGKEVYIELENHLDNYLGSITYQILRDCQINNWSKLPNKMINRTIPASETGLTRILIDYSEKSGVPVINVPKVLNPAIMSLRSEYPEEVSVILSEKLVKFHNEIYKESERVDIYDDYSTLSRCDNIDDMRKALIKLMRYWGYGSLVNVIEVYTLSTDEINYNYFNLGVSNQEAPYRLTAVFYSLNSIIIESMIEFEGVYRSLDFPVREFRDPKGIRSVIKNFIKSVSLSMEMHRTLFYSVSFPRLILFNTLLALLKDEDFVTSINRRLKKDYVLSSIPVNYQNRFNFIALYNTLCCLYYRGNSRLIKRNYKMLLDRKADELNSLNSNYKSMISNVNPEYKKLLNLSPSESYYSGYLDHDVISQIMECPSISVGGYTIRVNSKIKPLSRVSVTPSNIIKLKRPLTEDFLDSEEWDEINQELGFDPPDEETIQELWDSTENQFEPTKTKYLHKKSKIISAEVNWVILPNIEGFYKPENFIRQVGENVVLLSNCYVKKFCYLPNSHVRVLNFNRGLEREDNKSNSYIAHVVSSEILRNDFWERYLGGKILNLTEDLLSSVSWDIIRDDDGEIKKAKNIGAKIELEDFRDAPDKVLDEIVTIPNASTSLTEEEIRIRDLESMIEKAYHDKIISKITMNHLKKKYLRSDLDKIFDIEKLFSNCVTELELNRVWSFMEKGEGERLNISKDDIIKIYTSPEYFDITHSYGKGINKTIKDKRLKAELECFHTGLSNKIGSDKLFINEEAKSSLKANLKLWSNTIKLTKYKVESKRFCLLKALTIINTAKPTGVNGASDDIIWDSMIKRITKYIADDGPEEDENDLFSIDLGIKPTSRTTYKPVGY
jgi:hypothetical protein